MTHPDFIWPQHGDEPDAAHFAYAYGVGAVDYVEEGMAFKNVDYTNLTFDIDPGRAILENPSMTTASSDIPTETFDNVGMITGFDGETGLGLTDTATNYVYLDANPGTDDTPVIDVNTTGTAPSNVSILVGIIDTSNNFATEINRFPEQESANVTASISANYTTNGEGIIFVDSSAGAITVTLSRDDNQSGKTVAVIDEAGNAKANNITIATEGSETVNGGSSILVKNDYGTKVVGSDGSNWFTTGKDGVEGVFQDEDGDGIAELLSDFGGVQFGDDDKVELGSGSDFWWTFDATATELQLVASDTDGAGTTGVIAKVPVGGSSFNVPGSLQQGGTNVALQSRFPIPNSDLQNSTLTVAGNAVGLGGSTPVALGDLSDVTASGEGSGNGFDADTVDNHEAEEFKNRISVNLPTTKLNAGEYSAMHRMTAPTTTLEVYEASVSNDSFNAPAGLEAYVRNATAATSNTFTSNHSSGTPVTSITFTAGDNVEFGVDNGNYGSGTGAVQYANGYLQFKWV